MAILTGGISRFGFREGSQHITVVKSLSASIGDYLSAVSLARVPMSKKFAMSFGSALNINPCAFSPMW